MESQHHRVEELIARARGVAAPGGRPKPARRSREEVASTFDEFRVALLEHLDDEEQHILPIAARCVTQEEWNALGQHGIGEG